MERNVNFPQVRQLIIKFDPHNLLCLNPCPLLTHVAQVNPPVWGPHRHASWKGGFGSEGWGNYGLSRVERG